MSAQGVLIMEVKAVKIEESNLHKLVSSMFDVQKLRISLENRFRGMNDNKLIAFIEGMGSLEGNVKGIIKGDVQQYPIHKWIIAQNGLSFDLAGQLIGLIHPISRFSNISKLHAYAGMAVIGVCETCGKRHYTLEEKPDKILHTATRLKEQWEKKIVKEGQPDFVKRAIEMTCTCEKSIVKKIAQRKIKDSLLDYNPALKMVSYKVGTQFIKQGDYYRKLYDEYRKEYALREDLKAELEAKKGKKIKAKGDGNGSVETETKGSAHIHRMAQRKMVKDFLSDLWVVWRELEGLPVTMPYAIGVLGHSDYRQPAPPTAKQIKEELMKVQDTGGEIKEEKPLIKKKAKRERKPSER